VYITLPAEFIQRLQRRARRHSHALQRICDSTLFKLNCLRPTSIELRVMSTAGVIRAGAITTQLVHRLSGRAHGACDYSVAITTTSIAFTARSMAPRQRNAPERPGLLTEFDCYGWQPWSVSDSDCHFIKEFDADTLGCVRENAQV